MNTKRLLTIFVVLLSVTLLLMFALLLLKKWIPSSSVRDLPEIMKQENKILNVVTEYNSIDFYVDGDTIAGFQYELCRFIDKCSGLTVQIHLENNLETSIRKLNDNVFDVIAQNIPITNENRQFLAFTVPIAQSRQVLIQRKKNNTDSVFFIANQLDLANQTIYVAKNSPAILRLNNLSEEIAEPIHIKEVAGYTSEQLIYMLIKKEIDYAVVDREIALKNLELFPDLDFNTDISFTQLQAWALRKTSPVLLDSLNVWITAFIQNKSLNLSLKK